MPHDRQINSLPIVFSLSCGSWASANPYPITERTEILWTRLPQLSERAFALVIEGESMIDEFYPGDIVIADPEISPRPGDYEANQGRDRDLPEIPA